jgi:hypothetical protein
LSYLWSAELMPDEKPRQSGSGAAIDLDVLVIGGGVQGLWLLNDLHEHGYSALLLERRELGGEQTCHSHVYIHQGHLYQESELAERLKAVTLLWETWLRSHRPRRTVMPSYFGFQNRGDADEKKKLWQNPRLDLPFRDYREVAMPLALKGGTIKVVLESHEVCLNGRSLMLELQKGLSDFIGRIDDVADIRLNIGMDRIDDLEVVIPGGRSLTFRPGALILAAGCGNQALLDRAAGGRHSFWLRVREVQQIRKGHMLVVKGEKRRLPPLTGVFHPYGLFIVSRNLGKETVWLVSDNRSEPLSSVDDWLRYDERWWLPLVVEGLREIAPRYFNRPMRFKWGVYAAPKAEGRAIGAIPHEERIEQFRLSNLWAVWPTKLTLAPKVSSEVIRQLPNAIKKPTPWSAIPVEWSKHRVPVTAAPERWEKTAFVTWKEFRECYNIR